jgi:hypothetical protein
MYQQPGVGIEDGQVPNPTLADVVDRLHHPPAAAATPTPIPNRVQFNPNFRPGTLPSTRLDPTHRPKRVAFPSAKYVDKILVSQR